MARVSVEDQTDVGASGLPPGKKVVLRPGNFLQPPQYEIGDDPFPPRQTSRPPRRRLASLVFFWRRAR